MHYPISFILTMPYLHTPKVTSLLNKKRVLPAVGNVLGIYCYYLFFNGHTYSLNCMFLLHSMRHKYNVKKRRIIVTIVYAFVDLVLYSSQ